MSARASGRAVAVTPALLRKWPLPQPGSDADKEDRGIAMVIGGASQVPGALALAGVAALRAGAGKLQIGAPASAAIPLGVAIPEARIFALTEDRHGYLGRKAGLAAAGCIGESSAVLIGPGMLNEDAIRDFVGALIPSVSRRPVVLDAAALTGLRGRGHEFDNDSAGVLTPNVPEMARLADVTTAAVQADLRNFAQQISREYNAVVALKASETFIATPDGELFRYSAGDVGLATSGSGDILAGVIVGLLARGAGPEQAAVWGVWLHGEAGNRLKKKIGPVGFLARELSGEIPALMGSLAG
jgi:ADP-dependent NAD(P)H-hydrate dehydratase